MQYSSVASRFFVASFAFVAFAPVFFSPSIRSFALDLGSDSQDVEASTTNELSPELFQPVAFVCEGEQLGTFLERFSKRARFEYFIDRRVDPSTPISGSFSDVPLIDALRKTLEDANLSFCCVDGTFVWIGPRDASGELLLLFALKRAESSAWPAKVVEKATEPLNFSIADFAEPRDVFQALSKRLKTKFVGVEKTPFDRWRGADFRGVVASDMASTLLFGFGVDYCWDDSIDAFKLVKLDKSREIKRSYPSELVQKLDRRAFSGCRFTGGNSNEETDVVGTFADVAQIEYAVALLANEASRPMSASTADRKTTARSARSSANLSPRGGKSRKEVSGLIQNKKLRDVFAYLETNLGTTFSLDSSLVESGVTLDKKISCEFKKADKTQIAETIAAKIGATYRVEENAVVFLKSKARSTAKKR